MKKKDILLFSLIFIYTFVINYFAVSNYDLIWNYGFCYNVSKGLKMYSDFNMVITPLFPTIFGLLMKLFGSNTLVFFLFNALVPTLIYFIVYKYYNRSFLETILVTTFVCIPNYNLLCILFLFILFILEDKKKNDYLIGIVLGLVFLTKSSFILLTLASIYYIKDFKKVFKRFIGFLIPNIIFILYFYLNGSLYDYINYAFLSLFDFASDNLKSGIGVVITICVIIYLVREYINKRDIKILYILLFQIMAYPIFNLIHIIYSIVPVVFYIFLNIDNKFYLKYKKYLYFILICPLLSTLLQIKFLDLKWGTGALSDKLIENKYIVESNVIKSNVNHLDNTYFIMYDAYVNKLLLDLDINKYDVMLTGNLGYNGEKNTIKYFNSLDDGTQFLLFDNYEGGQAPKKVYNYIKNNYKLVSSFGNYELYVK